MKKGKWMSVPAFAKATGQNRQKIYLYIKQGKYTKQQMRMVVLKKKTPQMWLSVDNCS